MGPIYNWDTYGNEELRIRYELKSERPNLGAICQKQSKYMKMN